MKTFSLTHPRHLLFIFALSLISFMALPTYASPPDAQHQTSVQDDQGAADGMNEHMRMADELKLSDKQRELFKSAMKEKISAMRSVRDLHEQLHDLTQSDDYTVVKAKEIAHKSSIKTERDIVSASKSMHEFYTSLSPEQKAKLKDMRKDIKKKMKDRMKDHKGRACDDEDGGDANE